MEPVKVRKFFDNWVNTFTGLGTDRDKRSGGLAKQARNTIDFTFFEALYHGNDLAAKIADLAPKEMVREWIEFTAQQSDDESDDGRRVETPQENKEVSDAVIEKLHEIKARKRLKEAATWARVYGGSLVLLGVDDGADPDDPARMVEPLDIRKVQSLDFLTVLDRFEVSIDRVNEDPSSELFGLPETYRINPQGRSGQGTIQESRVIHSSRFLRFDGVQTSRRRMQQNGGWSDSIYIRIEEVLRDFGLSWASVAHVLQEFSISVYKFKGLAEMLASDEQNIILERMKNLDRAKGVSRGIPIDAEFEEYERQAVRLSGLPDTMVQFAFRVASAANMPVVLLFGMSPAGLSATGESDLTFWFNEVRTMQEEILRDPIDQLINLIFATEEIKEPDKWSFDFNPLWTLDEKEESDRRLNNAKADTLMIDGDVVTPEEVAESRFGGDKYGNEIILDKEKRDTDLEADVLARERQLMVDPPVPPVVPPGNGAPPAPPVPGVQLPGAEA